MAWWNDWSDFQNEWNSLGQRIGDAYNDLDKKLHEIVPYDVTSVPYQLMRWDSIKNNPEEVDRIRNNDPIAKDFVNWYYNTKRYEDAKRYYEDKERNTGESWENSKYPWLDYENNGPGRYSVGNVELFEASQAVISMYSRKLNKWRF